MIRAGRAGLALIACNLIVMGLAIIAGKRLPARQMIYDALINGDSDIFILDVAHRLKFNLTHHIGEDSRPTWSPNGNYIAFESWRDGTRAVYVMAADGSNLHRLTSHTDASEYAPEWTSDGDAILFRYYKHPETGIYRARPDGSDLQKVEAESVFRQQPIHDRQLSNQFIDGAWGIYITEGTTLRQLTNNNLLYEEPPQWSADENMIAFLSQHEWDAPEIFVMDHEGNDLRQMTMDGIPKSNLSWRP